MKDNMIGNMQQITSPFSGTWEHVQGPGGNTSFKADDLMVIKASGYTFKNVSEGEGFIWVNPEKVKTTLGNNYHTDTLEGEPPQIEASQPDGLRPSMEFEFHALLDRYVLHTHSVYVNVMMCSMECDVLLAKCFPDMPFTIIPAVLPGHPLAVSIYNKLKEGINTNVFFLRNHGIIIHGPYADSVLALYKEVQEKIMQFFGLAAVTEDQVKTADASMHELAFSEISFGALAPDTETIEKNILVPDQSIFFRGKISGTDKTAPVFIDTESRLVLLNGSAKFREAAVSMLRMVYYILNNQQQYALTTSFIPPAELDALHGLSSEKYRVAILKDK